MTSYHWKTLVLSALLLFHVSAHLSPFVGVGTLRRIPYRLITIFLTWVGYGGRESFIFTCKYGWIFLAYRRRGINLYILCGLVSLFPLDWLSWVALNLQKIYLGFFLNADFGLMIYTFLIHWMLRCWFLFEFLFSFTCCSYKKWGIKFLRCLGEMLKWFELLCLLIVSVHWELILIIRLVQYALIS